MRRACSSCQGWGSAPTCNAGGHFEPHLPPPKPISPLSPTPIQARETPAQPGNERRSISVFHLTTAVSAGSCLLSSSGRLPGAEEPRGHLTVTRSISARKRLPCSRWPCPSGPLCNLVLSGAEKSVGLGNFGSNRTLESTSPPGLRARDPLLASMEERS